MFCDLKSITTDATIVLFLHLNIYLDLGLSLFVTAFLFIILCSFDEISLIFINLKILIIFISLSTNTEVNIKNKLSYLIKITTKYGQDLNKNYLIFTTISEMPKLCEILLIII